MHLEPDPVAEPVAVRLAEPRGLDPDARRRVDVAAVRAGAHGGEAGELRLGDERVGLGELRGQLAGRERPRAVGAVAVDDAAHVDRDERPLRDHGVARAGVRPRAVLARGDDRPEGEALGAVVAERALDPPGHVGLGAPDEPLLAERRVDRVGDRARTADRLDLARRPSPRAVPRRTPRVGTRSAPAGSDRLPLRVGHSGRLEADPPSGEQLGERADDVALRAHDLDAVDAPARPRGSGSRCRASSPPPGSTSSAQFELSKPVR